MNGAHPRVCGENIVKVISLLPSLGSSPRMRGKRMPFSTLSEDAGLIPAYAGKTMRRNQSRSSGGAHPRVCGENVEVAMRGRHITGSSPRMRGKPVVAPVMDRSSGLIPAYAGKTASE